MATSHCCKGMMKAVLAEEDRRGEVLDHEFINRYTTGFDEFAEAVREDSWDEIVEQSGIPRSQIEEAAQDLY